MAVSQLAAMAERAIGHNDNNITAQDVTNYEGKNAQYGDPSEMMKALAWMGKNTVKMSSCTPIIMISFSI